MRSFIRFSFCALGALGAVIPAASYAATTTATMTVTANVVAVCTVSAAPLSFGNYSGAVVNASTTVSPNCSSGTPYAIGIDTGVGAGATTAVRKLTNGANTLNYSVYTTNSYATVWGNTVGTDTVSSTGTGTTQTINVFGRVPAGQSSVVGAGYTDTLTITLTF